MICKPCRSPRGSVDWNDTDENMTIGKVSSLPSWERGLKFWRTGRIYLYQMSLPSWERGLKLKQRIQVVCPKQSLPSWERGLKYTIAKILICNHCRSPRGSVDWNSHTENHLLNMLVAPLAGAWIEIDQASPQFSSDISRSPRGSVDWNIFCHRSCTPPLLSLPSWERGLKSRETLWEWVGSVVTQTIKYWIWGGLGKKYPFST